MAMNDEETVMAAGGHTFGKAHGAAPESNVGPGTRRSSVDRTNGIWLGKRSWYW